MLRNGQNQAHIVARSLGQLARGLASSKKITGKETSKPKLPKPSPVEMPTEEPLNASYLTKTIGELFSHIINKICT